MRFGALSKAWDRKRNTLSVCSGPEERQEVTIFQNGIVTSGLRELTSFSTRPVQVAMRRLDSLLGPEHLRGPLLLKLDVQGVRARSLAAG